MIHVLLSTFAIKTKVQLLLLSEIIFHIHINRLSVRRE